MPKLLKFLKCGYVNNNKYYNFLQIFTLYSLLFTCAFILEITVSYPLASQLCLTTLPNEKLPSLMGHPGGCTLLGMPGGSRPGRERLFFQLPENKLKIFWAPLDCYKYFIDICKLLKKLRKYN